MSDASMSDAPMSDASASHAWAPSPWLTPRFPLDDTVLPSGPRFAITDGPPADRFVFRGGGAARASCSAAFAAPLPPRLGAAGRLGDRAALWLGPDEWLLIAESGSVDTLAAALEAGLAGVPHSLVDVSHREVGLIVSGAVAARVLNAGCPLDLRLKSFPVGMATRTLFDKAEIVLWRLGETEFRVEVARSFSPWLAAALDEAARGAPEV